MCVLAVDSDGPDVFRLVGRFLTYEFSLVPSFALAETQGRFWPMTCQDGNSAIRDAGELLR